MFKPQHIGLIFSKTAIKTAQNKRNDAVYKDSWMLLKIHLPKNDFELAQLQGLRYRFNDDTQSGASTITILPTLLSAQPINDTNLIAIIRESFVVAQCVELVRDHNNMTEALLAQLQASLIERVKLIDNHVDGETQISHLLWLATLKMAVSVVLEDEALFNECVTIYQQTIDEDVRPEGYLPRAINGETAVDNFLNQIRSAQALTLMAEMARHAGIDLYAYEKRGVSVLTATTYPLYYYFFPEKWKWVKEVYKGGKIVDTEVLEDDDAKQIYRNHAGFLEVLNTQYGTRPLKAIRMILDDLRPLYDVYGGGITTLTNGYTEKKRRGWFG